MVMAECQGCTPDCLSLHSWKVGKELGLSSTAFSQCLWPLWRQRAGSAPRTAPRSSHPFMCQRRLVIWTLVWEPALGTAYCSKPVKDSCGSQSNLCALASFSLTESAVASSVSPRDVPLGVSPPAGLEVVLSLLYNQCMFPADVSRSCPGAI